MASTEDIIKCLDHIFNEAIREPFVFLAYDQFTSEWKEQRMASPFSTMTKEEQLAQDFSDNMREFLMGRITASDTLLWVKNHWNEIAEALYHSARTKAGIVHPLTPLVQGVDPAGLAGHLKQETVHVFHGGVTLCGKFIGMKPYEWPKNHSWVSIRDAGKATCGACEVAYVNHDWNKP